jgi:hypothetical protein
MWAALALFSFAASFPPEEVTRQPLPEPIFLSSPTRIDSTRAGTFEIDLLGGAFIAPPDAGAGFGALELEFRATQRFGFALDLAVGRDLSAQMTSFDGRLSGAYTLLADFARELFVALVGSVRVPFDPPAFKDPRLFTLPLSLGLEGAARIGMVSVRGELDLGGGEAIAELPFRAAITGLIEVGTFGFLGVGVLRDWAAPEPAAVAGEVDLYGAFLGVPFSLGADLSFRPTAPSGSRERSPALITRLSVLLD